MLPTWSLQYAKKADSDLTARFIANFVNTIIQKGNTADWHAFEQFHATMELLKHWAAGWTLQEGKQRKVDISAWYGEEAIAIKQKSGTPFSLLFKKKKNEDDAMGTLSMPLPHIIRAAHTRSSLPHFEQDSVVLMCANQPAFDSFVMVNTGEGKKGLVLIENRFSSDHKATLTVDEVVGKFDLLTKGKDGKASVLATMMATYGVEEENLVYVIAAMRNLPGYADAIKKSEKSERERVERRAALDGVRSHFRTDLLQGSTAISNFKGTVVIAPRPALKHYYGPTLAQCGVLAVSRFGGVHQSVADEE